MATTIIKRKCSICKKTAQEVSRLPLGNNEILITLECKHAQVVNALKADDITIVSSDGRELFPFQLEGVEFVEKAGGRAIIADEMGLGKTVQACAFIKRNLKKSLPTIWVCKAGLKAQTFAELYRWTGLVGQVIENKNEKPLFEIFPVTIISYDLLWRMNWDQNIWSKYQLVILDEFQMIKNPGAKRTQIIRTNLKDAPYAIPLSGTPIKNNALEYFVGLNFVRPTLFESYSRYISVYTNLRGGLKNPEFFHRQTADFIIRRKREQVLPDLPKIFRNFRLAEMLGGELEAYKKVVKEFQEFMSDLNGEPGIAEYTNILAYFSKMRHLTGVAKANAAIDFVEEFLLETDRKMVVFVHHKIVGEMIARKLAMTMKEGGFNEPLVLTSELDTDQRAEVVRKFWQPGYRILIASTLASGEGLNLQCCSDCLIVERQWNPANEEQAEARFPRPGSTADKVNATYLIAAGTIDDFLTELVEKKRAISKSTLDNEETKWDEGVLMKELAWNLASKGLKKWAA